MTVTPTSPTTSISSQQSSITSPTTDYAAANDAMFGFTAKHGGSIHVVGAGSEKALNAASQMLLSLGNMKSVAQESSLGMIVAGAASTAALGSLDATALFVGAAAGAIGSFSKGSNPTNIAKSIFTKGWTI